MGDEARRRRGREIGAPARYLRLARNELDDAACEAVVTARPGVGPKTVEALRERSLPLLGACRAAAAGVVPCAAAPKRGLGEALRGLEEIYAALAGPRPLREALRALDGLLLPAAAKAGEDPRGDANLPAFFSGSRPAGRAGDDADAAKARRTARAEAQSLLQDLRARAAGAERDNAASAEDALRAFLDASDLDAGAETSGEDVVTLSTIHRAKGLEWSPAPRGESSIVRRSSALALGPPSRVGPLVSFRRSSAP